MITRRAHACIALLFVAGGCDNTSPGGKSAAKAKEAVVADPAPKHAGVWPEQFQCDSIATLEQLTALLGAPVAQADVISSVPNGVAKPCAYEVNVPRPATLPPDAPAPGPEAWSFDFDCRDNYKATADALFLQYREINKSRIDAYNTAADAGIPPNDANLVYHQPGAAFDVDVGAKGLDHNDQSILFIDDDAPCYVRVNGPDPVRRLALAKLVAKNLTYVNAPMSLRPLK